jgi:RNA polymerase sigma-70 factor (ECF subfamily)
VVATTAAIATHTDEELMSRVAAGDVRAFEALYDRHSRHAFALARRITDRTADAEEATQDAFMSLWRSAATFDGERASLRTWLLMIVRNRSIDRLRAGAHAHHDQVAEHADRLEAAERTEEQVMAMQDYLEARRLVADLPPEQREIIDLAYIAGYTQNEIAARVGIPIGTVKGRARLGLNKLRRAATSKSLPPQAVSP